MGSGDLCPYSFMTVGGLVGCSVHGIPDVRWRMMVVDVVDVGRPLVNSRR